MGIWIRSQDRKTITNANDIYIRSLSKGCALCTGKGMDLGVYSSEEKAVKILDMIQQAIIGKKPEDYDLPLYLFHEGVFVMPHDSEVDA